MALAQGLYEGQDVGEGGTTGLITYMRTDNAILSQEAIDAASAIVKARWGEAYLGGVASSEAAPAKKKVVKKKAAAAPMRPRSPPRRLARSLQGRLFL